MLFRSNAALVEETISASQLMTGQVRDLNETLGRFHLGGEAAGTQEATGVPISAAAATPPAPVAVGEGR